MDLLQRILECKEEEIDSIIEQYIKEADATAEKVDKLGFLDYGQVTSVFKGFIPLKTRIKYSNLNMEDYGMETTDYIYEFARFIRKNRISSKVALIISLETFINSYFGFPGRNNREELFGTIAWETTNTDEEYFNALKNNKLGDLKGKGAAECTERGALAQQILSIFGTKSYYCMGCVDLGGKRTEHCFNIIEKRDDYALLDYSIPVSLCNPDSSVRMFCPFIGTLTKEEFLDFINNGTIKSFADYYMNGDHQEKTGSQRIYAINRNEIIKKMA